jgi:radical SAM superfamily enzyme YgiQ (UPF0313 family)
VATHLYLISPRTEFPGYFEGNVLESFGYAGATITADLALPTVAAMAPPGFNVELLDENVAPIDWDTDAPLVGVTGKVSKWRRMRAIAEEFRRRGKTVLLGGPHVSLIPTVARRHCDILVLGEIEEIAPDLFADLAAGHWKDEYVGGKPDLARCPVPAWSLYPNDRTLTASVQTSRGCPFECEFCDVIQYLGRKQRHKPPANVLTELDVVYRHGYRSVFLSDDNLTVYRARARELLAALRDWNLRQEQGAVRFQTQLSVDAAKDPEILELCAAAGLTDCFVGIETPNEESLRETKKRQNLHVDLVEQVQRFVDHGIMVMAGMIVGFDHDGPDIFQRQLDFAQSSPIPIFNLSTLVAADATPLRARMANEGRLLEDTHDGTASSLNTNIVPRQMTREELERGVRWLLRELYRPAAFGERMVRFIERMGPRRDPLWVTRANGSRPRRSVEFDWADVACTIPRLSEEDATMWSRVKKALARRRDASDMVWFPLFTYMQIRHIIRQLDAEAPASHARHRAAAGAPGATH